VAECSLAWLLGFRRLGVRYERRSEIIRGHSTPLKPYPAGGHQGLAATYKDGLNAG
jgi:hypothetical protein